MLNLVEAEEKHSHLLQTFFSEQVLSGHVNYSLYRPNSFFDQYRLLSDDYNTAMLMDDENKVLGAASITFSRAYVNRQEQTVGYLSDLRIAPQRIAIQKWAKYFIPYLYEKLEIKNCNYVFSAIEQFENQAYNALLRPQKLKRNLPHYYLFRQLYLVFYLGRWPWARSTIPSIRVSHAWDTDIEEICDYLLKKKIGSRLYFNINPKLLSERFKTWPNFSIHNFLIARDAKNNIIGCMAPWNNQDVQQFVIKKYNGQGQLLRQTLKIGSPFRFVHNLPKPEQQLNLKVITHSAVDNAEVFYSLLAFAYSETTYGEILAHTNYIGDYLTRPPDGFIATKIPYGFYSVFRPEQDLPSFLHPNPFTPPPDFNFVNF